MPPSLSDILDSKRILVCVGSGGVGKTTTSAALALEGARRGKKTLVLTIDPARRLANSLGLPQLDHEQRRVPDELIGPIRPGGRGALYAMMLDQKRAFDEVLTKYARDPGVRQRVMDNRIYQQISSSLTGSHEYAAMSKLYEVAREQDYDLIVVDTPPTAHALDFLDAPRKITEAVDSPAIEWFVKPMKSSGQFSLKLIGMGGSFVLKRVARFVGSAFLEDMGRFFVEAGDVLRGFRERAGQVFELLRKPEVGFVLVAAPDPSAIEEALFFHERLMSSNMPFAGFVVNRVHAPSTPSAPASVLAERLAERPETQGQAPYDLRRAADAIVESDKEIGALAAGDALELERLRKAAHRGEPVVIVPFFDRDIHDIEGLTALGDRLLRS